MIFFGSRSNSIFPVRSTAEKVPPPAGALPSGLLQDAGHRVGRIQAKFHLSEAAPGAKKRDVRVRWFIAKKRMDHVLIYGIFVGCLLDSSWIWLDFVGLMILWASYQHFHALQRMLWWITPPKSKKGLNFINIQLRCHSLLQDKNVEIPGSHIDI